MNDFDSPWKEVLDRYFDSFLAFFFPKIHGEIDWSRGYVALDKELQQIMPDAETGRRYVDKLVKVWRMDGAEEWVLIHVEIQHSRDHDFPKRIFTYYHRLIDRHDRQVASLAVLADERPDWRPTEYNSELWGCGVSFRFPVVKLLDWAPRWQELERHANPFAVVVLADLKSRETRKDPESRKDWKFRIVRGLYEHGWKSDDIRQLFRFIDWVIELPESQASVFDEELAAFEKEKAMPYVTSIERRAMERGKVEGKVEGKIEGKVEGKVEGVVETLIECIESQLGVRFGAAGIALMPLVRKITEPQELRCAFKKISAAGTLLEVQKALE